MYLDFSRKIKKIFITIFIFLIFPNVVWGAPIIEEAVGIFSDGENVTMNGNNFGVNGPDILIYDEFNGNLGEIISSSATIGNWTSSSHSPTYIDDNDNMAAFLVDGVASRQLQISFEGVQEIFISYKVKIPIAYHFPNTVNHGDFAPDSAWKMAWLMDGATGYMGDDDICLPTWPNGTYFMLAGNDNAFQAEVGRPNTASNWFGFNEWNRVSTYLKGGLDPVSNNGIIWFSGISDTYGQKIFYWNDRPLFNGDTNLNDDDVSEWNFFRLSGWHRTGGVNSLFDSTTGAIYDDVYVATGAGSRARIEIGNNGVYNLSTKMAFATPNSWSDNNINFTFRKGAFQPGETAYLYVTDANGEVNTEGFPIVINSFDTVSPNPPSGLNVM